MTRCTLRATTWISVAALGLIGTGSTRAADLQSNIFTVGQSGANTNSGTPGNGANASLIDATSQNLNPVSVNPGDTVSLGQAATGGNGGYYGGGIASQSGGNGGTAISIQDWTEYNASSTVMETTAHGGEGGTSIAGHGGVGGDASASSTAHLGGDGRLDVTAIGGGSSAGLPRYGGGTGGNATAQLDASTINGGALDMTVSASAGAGGDAIGVGKIGGTGGLVLGINAFGSSDTGNVVISAVQFAGSGGRGYVQADGANGQASNMVDAVSGSTAGSLILSQESDGGVGGYSQSGLGGSGGNALSRLTVSDAQAHSLYGTAIALGGSGGETNSGSIGSGGDARAEMTANSSRSGTPVAATAEADAGVDGAQSVVAPTSGLATSLATASALGSSNAVASSWVSGRAGSNATANSFSQTTAVKPAIVVSAGSMTTSAGASQSQAIANSGGSFSNSTQTQPARARYADAVTNFASISSLPINAAAPPPGGQKALGEIAIDVKYDPMEQGSATYQQSFSIVIDNHQEPLNGDFSIQALDYNAGGGINMITSAFSIVNTVDTDTLTFTFTELADSKGSSLTADYLIFDPLADPSLPSFDQTFASAGDANAFYAAHSVFDLGPTTVSAVPLGNAWVMFGSAMSLVMAMSYRTRQRLGVRRRRPE